MSRPALPPQIHVIVRDWLCANGVLLRSAEENVLIDTGYVTRAERTLELLQRPEALGRQHLHRIINTHGHSDHMGGNAHLQRVYGCPIAVPAGEASLIEAWDTRALWLDYAGQEAERFMYDEILAPGTALQLGGMEWQVIATPGHDMGAVVFFAPEQRILISGDALWQNGFGIVMPESGERPALKATRATLETLSQLEVAVVIPGHGPPFTDFRGALDRAFGRLQAFETDPPRTARHFLKTMFAFALLHLRRLPEEEFPAYLARTPVYEDVGSRSLDMSTEEVGRMLLTELVGAKVIARRDGFLVPVDVHEH